MLIAEYDYDTDIKVQRKESFEEGALYGIAQGIAQQKAKDERIIFAEREKVAQKDALLDSKNSEVARQAAEITKQAKRIAELESLLKFKK